MGQKMYNVTIQGITKQYPEKIPYSEIVKEYEGSTDAPVMLVIVNGRLRELHKHLKADCEIEFVTSKDPIGHKTYCRSASLILLKAIYDVAGQENIDSVVIHYSVGSGYYFTMKGPMALDQEFIDKVKAQMHRIVDENLPIVKRSVSTSEAVALFHKHHMYDKEKLLNDVKVYGNLDSMVKCAAVCTGSGKSMIKDVIKAGADVYVTGDIDHHTGIDTVAQGLALIDAGHLSLIHI